MGAISVEDLSRQVSDDVVGDLRTLSLDYKANKLSQIWREILLVVEKFNYFCVVLTLHVLDLVSILSHAGL